MALITLLSKISITHYNNNYSKNVSIGYQILLRHWKNTHTSQYTYITNMKQILLVLSFALTKELILHCLMNLFHHTLDQFARNISVVERNSACCWFTELFIWYYFWTQILAEGTRQKFYYKNLRNMLAIYLSFSLERTPIHGD